MKKIILGIIIGIVMGSTTISYGVEAMQYVVEKVGFPILVDGKVSELSNSALVINGITYLPLEETGKALGVKVVWNDDSKRVEVGETEVIVNNPNEFRNELIENFKDKIESFTIVCSESSNLVSEYYFADILHNVEKAQKTNDYICYSIKNVASNISKKEKTVVVKLTVEYWATKEQDEYVNTRTDEIIKEIITPDMNIYQKEKAVYEYITTNVGYDDSLGDLSRTAYSALKNNQAICQGFAQLTNIMLEKVGIENRIVTGTVRGKEPHGWNMVKLEGKWYHIDTTWDAAQIGVKEKTDNFFNVTADFMKNNDHQWDENSYPVCNP